MCDPLTLGVVGGLAAGGGGVAAGLTTVQALTLGLSAAGTLAGAAGTYQQAQTQKGTAKYNAAVAENSAQEALAAGEKDAQDVRRRSRQLAGQQRAAFSARGIDIADGSAAETLDQTDFFGEVDVNTARHNARRTASGYRARSAGYQAEADSYSPLASAGTTLLSGATSVADKWYRYRG